jgi:hypothetical protein
VVGDKSAKADGSVPYNTIFKPLRNALADAILNRDSNGNPLKDSNGNPVILVRVAFDHVELDDISNTGNDTANAKLTPNIVIFDLPWPDPNGQTHSPPWFIRHITLFTQRVDKSQ